MRIHQITSSFGISDFFPKQQPFVISYTKLSCFCLSEGCFVVEKSCHCHFSIKEHSLVKKKKQLCVTKERNLDFWSDSENNEIDNDEVIVNTRL